MWKFRTGYKLVNSMFLRKTRVRNLISGVNLSLNAESCRFSCFRCHSHLFYCTSLDSSNDVVGLDNDGCYDENRGLRSREDGRIEIGSLGLKDGNFSHENECDGGKNGGLSREYGRIESGSFGLKDGKFSHEIECVGGKNGGLSREYGGIESGSLGLKDGKFSHENGCDGVKNGGLSREYGRIESGSLRLKLGKWNHENACDGDKNGGLSREYDRIESGSFGLKDGKFSHENECHGGKNGGLSREYGRIESGSLGLKEGKCNHENEFDGDENGGLSRDYDRIESKSLESRDENFSHGNECIGDKNGGLSGEDDRVEVRSLGLRDMKCNHETCDNDEKELGDDEDENSSDKDEIETKSLGVKDENFEHELETLLKILRSRGCETDAAMCENTGGVNGIEMAKKLKQCGISPNPDLVIEVLSRIRNDWEVAYMFFLWASKQPGYTHSLRIYHSMISILAKRKHFDKAWILIDEMRKKGIVNHNTLLIMIRRYSAARDVTNAINTFHDFKRFDLPVGMEQFHILLSALTLNKNVQEAEHLLFSYKLTYPFNTKSFNIILNGWCNIVNSPRESHRFWKLMLDQGINLDVISYSSIISGYSKLNKVKEVTKLFKKMTETGLKPDKKVYNAVMYALGNGGRAQEALNHLHVMEQNGISPNSVTFNSLIKPLCRARNRDEAKLVYNEMIRRGLQPTTRTFHAFLRIQRTEEEISVLLDQMKELGCNPNKDTYLLIIKKFLRWRKIDKALMFWDEMKENGWNDDPSSYVTLVHGLFLNGKLEEAHKIYVEMKEKSLLPDAKTDELIQTWLANKEMAESPVIDSNHGFSGMSKSIPVRHTKGKDPKKQPEFRKVVKERGFSFWE